MFGGDKTNLCCSFLFNCPVIGGYDLVRMRMFRSHFVRLCYSMVINKTDAVQLQRFANHRRI